MVLSCARDDYLYAGCILCDGGKESASDMVTVTGRDFCIVKSVEYLLKLSASSPTASSALSMRSVSYMLAWAALMEVWHGTTLEMTATTMSSVSSIVASNFVAMLRQPDARTEVVASLKIGRLAQLGTEGDPRRG